jgi:hypothetical protein
MGAPTPRESFARLTYKGTVLGLYTVQEQIDERFLESRWPLDVAQRIALWKMG